MAILVAAGEDTNIDYLEETLFQLQQNRCVSSDSSPSMQP